MAAGCIPIVRRGFNGPWMEIIRGGQYGLGFSSIEELIIVLEKAIKHYEDFNIEDITLRSLEFDESLFKQRFIGIVDEIYATTNF